MLDKIDLSKFEIFVLILGFTFGILYFFFPLKYLILGAIAVAGIALVLWRLETGIFAAALLLPFLPTMAIIGLTLLIIFSFIIKNILNKNKFSFGPLSIWIAIFGGLTLLYSLSSVTPQSSLKVALVILSYLALYFVTVNTVTNRSTLYALMLTLIASASLEALYGVYQFRLGTPVIDQKWTDTKVFPGLDMRVFGTLDNPNILAQYLEFIIPLALGLFWYSKNLLKKALLLGAAGIMILCLVLTYSRGGWLALAFSIMVFGIIKDRRVLLLAGLAGLVSSYFLSNTIIERIASIGNLNESSNLYRTYIWSATIQMIQDFWYSGVGVGTDAFEKIYGYYMKQDISTVHAHNLYLQTLAEIGLLGALSFLMVLVMTFRHGLRTFLDSNDEFTKTAIASLIAGLSGFLLHGMSEYPFYNFKIVFLFWFIISLIMAIRNIELNNKSKLKTEDG